METLLSRSPSHTGPTCLLCERVNALEKLAFDQFLSNSSLLITHVRVSFSRASLTRTVFGCPWAGSYPGFWKLWLRNVGVSLCWDVFWQRLTKEERHLALGMVVVKVPRDFRGRKWSLADADVVRRCELTTCREISVSVDLHPDFSYIVVPFTSMPEQEGPFILRTFSSAPVRPHCPPPLPQSPPLLHSAELSNESCSNGVEDQGAEDALWGVCQERIITSVLQAVSRASGSPFSAQTWNPF